MITGVQKATAGSKTKLPGALSLLYKTVLELIGTQASLSEVLVCLCDLMERQFPALVCSVLLLDSDGVTLRQGAAPSLPKEYNDCIDGIKIGPSVGSCGTAAYRKEPVIVTDIASDPLWKDCRQLALPHGLRACWSTPILSRAGKVLGTFAVYYREPREPHSDHLHFVECASHLAGIAIEREQADAELQAAETRYRALVEHLPAITYIAEVGLYGRWHFVSPQIRSILGFSPEEWIDDSSNWMKHIHPEDRDLALAAEMQFWKIGGNYRAEYRMIARDGRVLWFRDDATYLRTADRQTPLMQGVLYDITENRQLEEQLRQSQKMEAVGQLAGGVAHDFNNLLMIIEGHTERLLSQLQASNPVYEDASQIQEAARRAGALTRQLLAFSRKQVLQPTVLDMNRVVGEVGKMLHRLIGEHIEVELIASPALWCVKADQSQMEQALLNLALNARDAMPQGGKVTIATHNSEISEAQAREQGARSGKYVVLEVTDTGSGMDAETQAHVFEPFFSTKELGKGTGLGLASVYGMVRQSGGWISFRTQLGHGTTFNIHLPSAVNTPSPAGEGTVAVLQTRGNETLLVVEDEGEIRAMVTQYLEQNGYTVLQANNGREALEIAGNYSGTIHLLVTDVVMPQVGGHELAQHLQRLRPRTKVLFTSGYPEHATLNEKVAQQDAIILQKPFPLNVLAGKIRDLLDASDSAALPAASATNSSSHD